jgi:uncharacterized protein
MFSGPVPARVNHRKLATEKRKIEGTLPLAQLERLSDAVLGSNGDIEVSLSFRRGRNRSGLVVGSAKARVLLECQNCMNPFELALEATYRHQLVQDEEQLTALDEEQDGIVCASEMVEIAELLEDELLLALPMVARHEVGQCPSEDDQLEDYQTEDTQDRETYKPFAGLAELTKDMIDKS